MDERGEGATPGALGEHDGIGYEAVVQFGREETWYRRAGRGQALLLLTRGDGPARDARFVDLSAHYLVIEPQDIPECSAWATWLPGVVDGLGLDRPLLFVGRLDLEDAERLVRDDPDRVAGVLLSEAIDR